ncbi:MAG: TIGR00266 family protein [Candidatus Aenigmarchaeota archaeon]|nr:TIGR00266 family protein [Candidatus Aenigmarchaeota archaeon]
MNYKITGNNLQIVTIELNEAEKVFAEAGAMVYMSSNMKMESKMRGGIMKAIGRKFAGETMFLTEYTPQNGKGIVAFGGNVPGTLKPLNIAPGNSFIAQKDAFLCAHEGVELTMEFQKRLGALFFGGEGFILQKISGNGTAYIHACGDFIEFNLSPGQTLKVDTGSVVGWDESVTYDIQRIKGIKTMFFGGEGVFLTNLTGPGKVIIQSMSLHNLANALFFTSNNTSGSSNVLGSLLGK